MRASIRLVAFWLTTRRVVIFLTVATAVAVYGHLRFWPRSIKIVPPPLAMSYELVDGRVHVSVPNGYLIAYAGNFEEEFFGYLMFDYLRSRPVANGELLIVHEKGRTRLVTHLGSDVSVAIANLYQWAAEHRVSNLTWIMVNSEGLNRRRAQTKIFEAAYSIPVKNRLEKLPRSLRVEYVRRFIRFKSMTDARVWKRLEPVPSALSSAQARQLAGDIIAVAEFFHLPLDLFLGVGAMENNYMDVRGDLKNTKWKRRAEKGDVVLRRARGKVLVLNDSAGVWQITRETLRYAHKLFLQDGHRDYCELPEHLRPPAKIDVNEPPAAPLTTYAGLLLRDLLDKFDGDVTNAIGAYNGGPARPNPKYAAGVLSIAKYAREMLERAAALHGQSIAKLRLLRGTS